MKLQIAITLAALAIGGSAFAQETPGGPPMSPEMQAARQAMRQACMSDARTLCEGKMGREAMMCLRQSGDKVSAPCKDAMSKMMAARRDHPG